MTNQVSIMECLIDRQNKSSIALRSARDAAAANASAAEGMNLTG
jgi:hypothetical protein